VTSNQAAIILLILDNLGMSSLHDIIEQHGVTPADIIEAWKSLESLAGMAHTAPDLADFD
jgi:DNA-binding MarR family transcriptional regulator